jgi:YfiH family protein
MSIEKKRYLTVPKLAEIPFIIHGFGTKHWTESDFEENPKLARFQRFSLRQTHSDIIRVLEAVSDCRLDGDAAVTDLPGILLIIETADCLPIFLVDVERKAIAAVHCGWMGTAKRIVQKTVKTMASYFGSASESMAVAMGPCIAGSCYEVGEDVRAEFVRASLPQDLFQPHPERKDKYYLDLDQANRLQLAELGVSKENIASVELCTHCDDCLLSYRRDRKTSRRLLNFIGLIS